MKKEKTGQIWVLDTDTKGTGAEMIPLEKAQRQRQSQASRTRAPVIRRTAAKHEPRETVPKERDRETPHGPRRFKLVDARTRQPLAEDVGTPEIVDLLEGVGNLADVHIYVRRSAEDSWRPLTLTEKKAVWAFRPKDPPLAWSRDRGCDAQRGRARGNRGSSETDRVAARHAPSIAREAHRGARPGSGRAPRSRPGSNR